MKILSFFRSFRMLYIAVAFLLAPLRASADEIYTYSSDYSYANDLMIGIGTLAVAGAVIALALSHHHHHDDDHHDPHARPDCDSQCEQAIEDRMSRYMSQNHIAQMQLSFKTTTGGYDIEAPATGKNGFGNYRYFAGTINRLFTSTVLLNLIDAGVLRLSDTIGSKLTPLYPLWSSVTLDNLWSMTSRIKNYAESGNNDAFWTPLLNHPFTKWEKDDLLSAAYPNFSAPYWQDSLTNDILLEKIIENSGRSMATEINNLIAANHLRDTFYNVDYNYDDLSHQSLAHGYFKACIVSDPRCNRELAYITPSAYRSAGALISTTSDITNWMWAFFHKQILTENQFEKITSMVCMGQPGANCLAGTRLPEDSTDFGYMGGLYRFGMNQIAGRGYDLIYYADGESFGHTMGTYYYPAKDIVITIAGTDRINYNIPAFQELFLDVIDVIYYN